MPQLRRALEKSGGQHIMIVCGGVIPHEDYDFLRQEGCSHIFGPGTRITDAATEIVEDLAKKLGHSR